MTRSTAKPGIQLDVESGERSLVWCEREWRIAAQIQGLWSSSSRKTIACEIGTGRLLIQGLHGGNVEAWRKRRRGTKDATLRVISNLLGGARSPAELYYAGCAYLLTQKYPHTQQLEYLSVGHFRQVAGLPEDQALKLLELASRERLSVRILHDLAGRLRQPGKGGRPRTPSAIRQVQAAAVSPLPPSELDLRPLFSRLPSTVRRELRFGLDHRCCRIAELSASIARCDQNATGRSVLVIDSQPSWRSMIGHWLHQRGFQVHAAAGATEASMLPAVCDVAVVADDLELAQWLFAERRAKRIVLVAELSSDRDLGRAIALGSVIERQGLPWGLFRALNTIEMEQLATQDGNPNVEEGAIAGIHPP